MSDPFFQKKRKRTTSTGQSESGRGGRGGKFGGRGGGRGGGGADRSKQSRAAPGPSRLRMREKAGKGRGGDEAEDDEEGDLPRTNGRSGGIDEDEADSGDDGGIEGMDLAHRYEEDLEASDEDAIDETPAEARVRLAKMYLDSLRADQDEDGLGAGEINAADVDRENISARLQRDAASHSTHMHDLIADRIRLQPKGDTTNILACRGHRLSVTSSSISHDCTSIWTTGKDGRIIRWRLRDGKMVEMISRASTSAETINGNGFSVNGTRKNGGNAKQSGSSGAARRRARAQAATERSNGQIENEESQISKDHCRLIVPAAGSGHTDEIWSLTSSQDGKFLATGGKDRRICIWATKSIEKSSKDELTSFVKSLGGHRDSITALRFRQGTYDLFSASFDRTLKLFDISQLSYVETFFGHQEEIPSLDILRGEVAVSAGARDRTCRWWKVRDESQLVFRGGAKSRMRDVLEGGDIMDEEQEEGGAVVKSERKQLIEGSIDAVAMIDEHTFLSGGDTGTISLWSLAKKKPVFTFSAAHGFEQKSEGSEQQPRWITSLTCLPYGDVFASGSWDGSIRLWKLSPSLKSFSQLAEVPALGFINSLQLIHPNKTVLKKRGGSVIDSNQWRRHGGLQGGAKKVFSDGETKIEEEEEDSRLNGNTSSKDDSPPLILVAALGQEPTRGRWQKLKEARNGTLIVPFSVRSI